MRARTRSITTGVLLALFAAAIVYAWLKQPAHPTASRLLALAPAPQNQPKLAGAEPLLAAQLPADSSSDASTGDPAISASSTDPDPDPLPARLPNLLSDLLEPWHRPPGVRRQLFTVTAYCPCPECCGKWARYRTTAAGLPVTFNRSRFVAADTRVLPFLTRVRVPGYAGSMLVPVIDRGGSVRGRHIDVFFPTHRQAERWGKKRLWIEIYP
jgi:3D (Asp-Asp-Asp) domain-containing protein